MNHTKRPNLDRTISMENFIGHYWLKKELAKFCRECGIRADGSKEELAARVRQILSGENSDLDQVIRVQKPRKATIDRQPSLESPITEDYRNSQVNRAFFKTVIGAEFHFTTRFMEFCRKNPDKTYRDAVDEWRLEQEERKRGEYKPEIARQFEYNRFIREYFRDNPGKNLNDAVDAWWIWRGRGGDN